MTIKKKKKKTHLDREPMDAAASWMDKIMKPHPSIDCEIAMKSYINDVNKSEGFDVRHKPPQAQAQAGGQKISRIYDPPNIVPKFYIVNELRCLSNLAISVYNQNKGTNYDNVQVMMAMRYGCRDEYYNITFKAASVPVPFENTVIFQTKACMILHRPYQIAEIKFVREFNGKDGEDKAREEESDVFGKDSEKLPLHLSEFALEQYNLDQLASSGFTMKQDEMYGGVNVLSWRKRRKGVYKGISIYESSTYSIKFKASLPNSTIVKNFRTKLLVSFYGSTAKLEIKYVKPKCPTN